MANISISITQSKDAIPKGIKYITAKGDDRHKKEYVRGYLEVLDLFGRPGCGYEVTKEAIMYVEYLK